MESERTAASLTYVSPMGKYSIGQRVITRTALPIIIVCISITVLGIVSVTTITSLLLPAGNMP